MNIFISVIIVTHNSQRHLSKAVSCLLEQTLLAKEILLVDSGSKDLSYLYAFQKFSSIKVIEAGIDVGFCRANNVGYAHVDPRSSYVFFINPDAFLKPHFLERAAHFFQDSKNKKVGAITGVTLGFDIDKNQPTGCYDTTGIFRTFWGRWYDRGQGQQVDLTRFQKQEEVEAICGAVFCARKAALNQVLLREKEVFDETFFMYKEDIDLSLRLKRKGWSLQFLPSLEAYHCRGWNLDRRKMARKFRLCSARNELTIAWRENSFLGGFFSLLKYVFVKVFNG